MEWPTHFSLIVESESANSGRTDVLSPCVGMKTGLAGVQQLLFLVLSCNRWADSLFNPVTAFSFSYSDRMQYWLFLHVNWICSLNPYV